MKGRFLLPLFSHLHIRVTIMIDEKYSAEKFSKLKAGSATYDAFLKDLGDEMASYLSTAIQSAFADIADQLRDLGHDLKAEPVEYTPEFHSSEYEYVNENDPDKLRIWLHTQTDAMSGYMSENEFLSALGEDEDEDDLDIDDL